MHGGNIFRIIEITEKDITLSADIIRRSCKTVADQFGLTEDNAPISGAFLKDDELYDGYRKGIKMFGLFDVDDLATLLNPENPVQEVTQAGFISFDRRGDDGFYIGLLAVLPKYRNKGGGRALMDFAKEYVRNEGGKSISISIINENKQLVKWYEKYGFEQKEVKIYPHLPFKVCFMKLELL